MQFKSRFVRGLPVLALAASLLVPFKPLAAAEGPYTAAAPVVSAAPAAQMTVPNPAAVGDELDAAGKLRQPGHGKKRHLITAAVGDELDATGKLREPGHGKKRHFITAAVDDELDAAGKLREPGHGKKRRLTTVSDELDGKRGRRKPRHV